MRTQTKKIYRYICTVLLILFATSAMAVTTQLPAPTAPATMVKILSTHAATTNDKTRIVLVLNNAVTFHSFYLQNPYRFVIDLDNFDSLPELKNIISQQTAIISVRDAIHDHNLRIVFDLKTPTIANAFFIPANGVSSAPRLVIDFTNQAPADNPVNHITAHDSNSSNTAAINSNPTPAQVISVSSTPITVSSTTTTSAPTVSPTTTNTAPITQAASSNPPVPATTAVATANASTAANTTPVTTDNNKTTAVIDAPANPENNPKTHRSNTALTTLPPPWLSDDLTTPSQDMATTASMDRTPPAAAPFTLFDTSRKQHSRDIVVVIDPGHGGKDPGASGPAGVHEKDIVLAIGRALQARLNQMTGIRAVMTRDQDFFVPLRGRLDISRRYKADLFVAIHADAYGNSTSQAEGATVYALSEHGASSEAARWLAEKDNYSELGGVQDFSDKSRLVRSVLLDLSQTVTIAQSLQIGKIVMTSLQTLTPLHHNIVEQAGFVVLKSPDIPSLLVETGFITNPVEEQRLNSSGYQDKLAQSLASGIEKYFWQNPPAGTLFARRNR